MSSNLMYVVTSLFIDSFFYEWAPPRFLRHFISRQTPSFQHSHMGQRALLLALLSFDYPTLASQSKLHLSHYPFSYLFERELWLYLVYSSYTWRVYCISSHMSRTPARLDSTLEESWYPRSRVYIFHSNVQNRFRDQENLRLVQYLPLYSIKLFIIQILYPCIPSLRRYLLTITYSNSALKETCLMFSLRETHPFYLRRNLGVL